MPIFRVQFRRDTTENWEKYNPILLYGEVGYEVTTTPDLILTKQGDGYLAADGKIYGTPWKDLPYCSGPPGPSPDYQWNGTILMFKKPDGEWGPGQDLVGPVPAHRWVGTALQFQTQTGSWGDLVDLQGTPGNANLLPATTTRLGGVIIGKGFTVNEQGCINVDAFDAIATLQQPGVVKPDGTTLTVDEEGVLSAVQNADATVARLEDLRKLSIGAPKFHRSTNLPPNHAWPDGSFVEFEDWPELAEVYEQGGFAGMLLPWDADAATQAANLGKFRPDAANPTGLYLPLHGGQFFRAWTLGQGADAGAWHRDEIRNIEGIFSGGYGYGSFTGPFRNIGVSGSYSGDTAPLSSVQFNASNVVSTGPQNVPQHIWQPVIIYLGRPR